MPKYLVISPVLFDGKKYGRGMTLEAAHLSLLTLVEDGVLQPIEIEQDDKTGANFERMTKQQLVEFAQVTYGLSLNLSLSKAELVAALNDAAAAVIAEKV